MTIYPHSFDHPERLPDEVFIGYLVGDAIPTSWRGPDARLGTRHIGDDGLDVPHSDARPMFASHDAYALRLIEMIADAESRQSPSVAEQTCAPLRAQLADLREWRRLSAMPTFAEACAASGIAGPFYTADEALTVLDWDAPREGGNAPTSIRCCGASVGIYVDKGEIGILGCEACGKRMVNLVGPRPVEDPPEVREPLDERTWVVDLVAPGEG